MNIEYDKRWSPSLHQEMELKIYGHAGKPIIVFPSSGGNFYEYEKFQMVEACRPFLRAGSIQLVTVDSIDSHTWLNHDIHPIQSAARHHNYERYILTELTPYIRSRSGHHKFMTTGCSIGAFHGMNFLCKHPDVFDETIALSGVYNLKFCAGENLDESVYLNSPIHYLPNLNDPWFLDQLRQSRIVICSGQGDWEQETLIDTYDLKKILEDKKIPAWVDIWGHDVAHDWPWWRIQMPYFLEKLGYHRS